MAATLDTTRLDSCSSSAEQIRELLQDRDRQITLLQHELSSLRHSLHEALQVADVARKLQRWRDDVLADDFVDRLTVTLEEYQDDGTGRPAICLDRDDIDVDLSEEDEFIPTRLIATRELADGETARFEFRLQADRLVYDVRYLDS